MGVRGARVAGQERLPAWLRPTMRPAVRSAVSSGDPAQSQSATATAPIGPAAPAPAVLPPDLRARMERALGGDFSGVRIRREGGTPDPGTTEPERGRVLRRAAGPDAAARVKAFDGVNALRGATASDEVGATRALRLLRTARAALNRRRGIEVGPGDRVAGAEWRAEQFHDLPPSQRRTELIDEIDRRFRAARGIAPWTTVASTRSGGAQLWRLIRDEVLFQQEYLHSPPEQVRRVIRVGISGRDLRAADYDQLFRIAKRIEAMPPSDVTAYEATITTSTTDLDTFERCVDRFVAERGRAQAPGPPREHSDPETDPAPGREHRRPAQRRSSAARSVDDPHRAAGQLMHRFAPDLGLVAGRIGLSITGDASGAEPDGAARPSQISLTADLDIGPEQLAALVLHELVHVAQHANLSTSPVRPDLRSAEAEAAGMVAALRSGRPLWAPVEVLPAGAVARNGGSKGVDPVSGPPTLTTSGDQQVLATTLKMLESLPDGEQRRGAISFLVALAMKDGPAQEAASARLVAALSGVPQQNLFDHMTAIEELKSYVGTRGELVYDYLLIARSWFADRSKNEIGSGLAVGLFQKYLHYQRGKLAIDYLRRRLTGTHRILAALAARIIADLLERQNTPEAARFQLNYNALRQMAMANGWNSYGALAVSSSTQRIFSGLEGVRQQADELARLVARGPYGDNWAQKDTELLQQLVAALGQQGSLRSATGAVLFSAVNREETEHALLAPDPGSTGDWLLEMARTVAIAVDAGARVQARTATLHANAKALDQLLGSAGEQSDERQALFDLRHTYLTAWLAIGETVFGPGRVDVAGSYQSGLDAAEHDFQNFNEVLAVRKFKTARRRFQGYAATFNQGNDAYPGNDQLKETAFFEIRDVLDREHKDSTNRLATGFSGRIGDVTVRVPPSDENIPRDLRAAAILDRDVQLFGMQAAVFLVLATNLSIHNVLVKSDVGDRDFQAAQATRLTTQRAELLGYWRSGDFIAFLGKVEAYQSTLSDVVERIKDRARSDFLLNLVITIIAALVTEGAALVIRLAQLSELAALARTAEALSSYSTLVGVGVFTTTQLTAQQLVFGKDLTALTIAKTAATNLAFAGALSAVGKLAEPLAQGSALRGLLVGQLMSFSGVAVVSLALNRIETGEWPADLGQFLAQTATVYLLIAGLHLSFNELVAKPAIKAVAETRLENLKTANDALMDSLRSKIDRGALSPAEFEAIRAERIRLVEEARSVGKVLKDSGVITAADFEAITAMADQAAAGARGATFPTAPTGSDPVVRALPAPDSVIELTQVGDTNTYVYDPAKSQAPVDALLTRYQEKGFAIEGSNALRRVVDPSGRTRFVLSAAPIGSTRLLLPPGSVPGSNSADPPLRRATGLSGARLDAARAALARINREAEAKLATEYSDYAVIRTLSLLVEQASVVTADWPIDAVRGLADALTLERGIPTSAVRRLFSSVPPASLPDLFAEYHDIVTSPKVAPGSQFLIADDLLPRTSVTLINAWRSMKARGLELPPDMDLRATRGVARQIDKLSGGWLQWLARIKVERRAQQLRALSGLVDPTVALPETTTQLIATLTADIPGHPGVNPLVGATGADFVTALETRSPGRFDNADLRASFVAKVDRLRFDVALLAQGKPLEHGNWEGILGRANEVRGTARVLLSGGRIVNADRDVGPKGPLPSVDLANVALPGGGKMMNAGSARDVHLDLLYLETSGRLVASELTTAELGLPEPWAQLDPKHPSYGTDIDMSVIDAMKSQGKSLPASYRKFMQALKIYQLNKVATALGTAWSGRPVDPALMVMSAGGFTAPAARALENLGFTLELSDGTRVTAAQVEAAKKGGGTGTPVP